MGEGGITSKQTGLKAKLPRVLSGSRPAARRAAAQGVGPAAHTGRHPPGSSHLHPDAAVRASAQRPGGHGGQRSGCHAAGHRRRGGRAAQRAGGPPEAADAREAVWPQLVFCPLSHPEIASLHQPTGEQPRRPVHPAGCAERRHFPDGGRNEPQVGGDGNHSVLSIILVWTWFFMCCVKKVILRFKSLTPNNNPVI